jgi:hypothetical protein
VGEKPLLLFWNGFGFGGLILNDVISIDILTNQKFSVVCFPFRLQSFEEKKFKIAKKTVRITWLETYVSAREMVEPITLQTCGRRVSTLVAFLDGIAEYNPTPLLFWRVNKT